MKLASSLGVVVRDLTSECTPQVLAGMAWSMAKLMYGNVPLRQSMASASLHRISEFLARELSTMAWAFSRWSVPHMPLLDSISAAALPIIAEFDSMACSNTVWSYAALGI